MSIGNDEVKGNVGTVAEGLPWLQAAIAKHHPDSKYNVDRNGGAWKPTWIDPPEFPDFSGYPQEKSKRSVNTALPA
ncbi:MAG TPA: hypothetical protein VHU83_22095 [Bryobacteraceae bacterium]|nr:hypothetical protein [Bryobacteraceae bacterium]